MDLTRYRLRCAYDGTGFDGWQSQPSGNAVQDHLERRLADVLGTETRLHGSGRTDAGVHARGQVAHFDADWRHAPERLLKALQARLPDGLEVLAVQPARAGFHARFSARGKRYRYRLHLGRANPFQARYVWSLGGRPWSPEAARAAAAALSGRRDYAAFAALRGDGSDPADTVRCVRLNVHQFGPWVSLVAEGDGFLYKMVRSLAGALVACAQGRLTGEELAAHFQTRQRTPAIATAPAHGLCLERVYYATPKWLREPGEAPLPFRPAQEDGGE